jgi:protein-L-isoaspartate(D-aspartate) O-methyltransferase
MLRAGVLLGVMAASAPAAQDLTARRQAMVEKQIQSRGVKDPAVLRSMKETPRHLFVPDALQSQAYSDSPLPIGYEQTISQPYIVAAMTEMLNAQPHHRVLEIGTGSGYQAAVLSPLVAHVYTIEIVPQLAVSSTALLRKLGYRNITVRQGDGYAGWPGQAPFDRIILTAAPPEIPQALIDQLKPGGRLVAPEGREYQEIVIIDKDAQGGTRRRSDIPVRFVPMVRPRPAK